MTQQSNKAYVITGYQVDTASIRTAIAANDQYVASLKGQQQQIVANGRAAAAQANGAREALEDLSLAYADIDQKNALQKLAKDAAAGRVSTEQLGKELQDLGATRAEIAGVANEIERIQRAARDAVDALPDPDFGRLPGERIGRTAPETLHTLGNAAIALPGIGFQSPIVVGLRGLELVADKTGASLTKMGAVVGTVGVFAIGAALAMEAFNASLERGRASLRAALVAQDAYYQALKTQTTEQVDQQIATLRANRPLLEQQYAETRNSLASQFGEDALSDPLGFGRFQRGLAKIIAPEAFEALDKQYQALQENIQLEARLAQGREAGAFEANDLAEAEDRLRQERRKAAAQMYDELFQNVDQTVETNLRLAELRRSGTSEQVEEMLAENRDRETLLRNFSIPAAEAAATSEAGKAKLEAYNNQLNELLRTDELLLTAVLPVIQARERERQAVDDQLGAIADGISYHQQLSEAIRTATVEQTNDRLYALSEERAALLEFLPALEALAPTSEDAALQLAEAQKRLDQIGVDFNDLLARVLPAALLRLEQQLRADIDKIRTESAAKERAIETERGEKEADAQKERDKAYLSAEEKRGEAVNKLAEDQAAAREKIERKANATIVNAIFARNALAAFLAEKQKKEDLEDLRKDGEKRAREIDKQFDEQKRTADRRYREQLDAARQAADKAIRLERERAAAEINEKVRAYNEQIGALRTFTNQGTQYIYDFVNNTLVGLAHLVSQARSMVNGIGGGAGGIGPGGIGGGVGGFLSASGGGGALAGRIYTGGAAGDGFTPTPHIFSAAPPRGTIANGSGGTSLKILSPTLNNRMLQGGGGGLTINIGGVHGSQLRKRDIQRMVTEKLDEHLTDAGWDD